MEKVLMAWSGGKDSAMALSELLANEDIKVAGLLTTLTSDYTRISMHGVRETLLESQALSLGLPLEKVFLSANASNEEYEASMDKALARVRDRGVETVAFGDIFLEDLRAYREENLGRVDMRAIFPIWKRNTLDLVRAFIDSGFKAVTTCVDTAVLAKRFVGRAITEKFLSDLPAGIDPCGENGEFHSFVHDGPIFKNPIRVTRGDYVLRENRFFFCDLIEEG